MKKRVSLAWRIGIASLALIAAIAVYSFTRIHPPELLKPFQATIPILATQYGLFGSAPSLFYTLAIGLLIGVCASTLPGARLHCLLWITLALFLELSQHPILAKPLSAWLAAVLTNSSWEIIRPYWTNGVFDPWDLLATLIGGCIALVLISYLPTEDTNSTTP